MPLTTTPRGKTEPVTNLTPSEAAMFRGVVAACDYLATREKCDDSKVAGDALKKVLSKWEKKPKAKADAK